MNATKRKFNALLQGIGTRSANSVSTTDESHSPRPSSFDSSRGAAESLHIPTSNAGNAPSTGLDATATAAAAATDTDAGIRNSSDMLFGLPSQSSTATTTATTSAVADLELLAKRRRIGLGNGPSGSLTAPGSNRPPRSFASARIKDGARLTAALQGGPPPQQQQQQQHQQAPPAPRYCPGDREQLLRRLATFQELTDWTPKPDRINEIEWAKRGWVCQGKERLRCTLCSKELVVRLSRGQEGEGDGGGGDKPVRVSLPEAAEEALVDKYVDFIVTAHQEDCLWQKKGCDDSLLRLPLANPRQALDDLRRRYDELCARKDFLPYEFNLRLPAGLDIDAVLSTLPPNFFDPQPSTTTTTVATTATTTPSDSSPSPPPPNRVALALAVMGWQGLTSSRIGPVPNSASCHACLRRLGLWMFKSKQVDLATNTVLEPAVMDHLDAVREHRFFCPWKNGAAQRNPGGGTRANGRVQKDADPPGWEVLVQVLRNDAYLRNRVTNAGARPRTAGGSSGNVPAATPSKTATEADVAAAAALVPPTTPVRRPATAVDGSISGTPGAGGTFGDDDGGGEDEAAREAKDRERWARLRRVKSLFDTKGAVAKKLQRAGIGSGSSSRPGTSHSSSLQPASQGQPE